MHLGRSPGGVPAHWRLVLTDPAAPPMRAKRSARLPGGLLRFIVLKAGRHLLGRVGQAEELAGSMRELVRDTVVDVRDQTHQHAAMTDVKGVAPPARTARRLAGSTGCSRCRSPLAEIVAGRIAEPTESSLVSAELLIPR
jgi:hypothetical protein